MFYVYCHYNKITGEIFYVGKGSNNRAFSFDNRNKYWHNIVNKYGYYTEIIKDNLTEDAAFELESFLIKLLKSEGLCKANLTLGGAGVSGYRHTDKTKNKLSKLRGDLHPSFGMKHSKEARLKMSKSKLNNKIIEVFQAIKVPARGIGKTKYIKGKKIGEFESQTDCADSLGLSRQKINRCLTGRRQMSGGYLFYYKPTDILK